ncbi:MAG: alpha-amylase family glycosyl hydrolase [Bacteroidota bacterium]
MLRSLLFTLCFVLAGSATAVGQILSVDPIFPRQTDTVTIVYDASQGNSALVGISPVYAHTGLITNQSTNPTDWQNVQGNWGTPDPNVIMTDLGGNRHSITYHIPTYYGFAPGTVVQELAFVFRDAAGNTVGRDTDGSDIFYPIYQAGQLATAFINPTNSNLIVNPNDAIQISGAASEASTLTLTDNGTQLQTATGTSLNYTLNVTGTGTHTVILTADNGSSTVADTFIYVVNPPINVSALPTNTELGINYTSGSSVRLYLYAPDKDFVYVLGDFNNYLLDTDYFMNQTPDGNGWWLDITGLTPGQKYSFQYFVDGEIKVADPYSEVVLDPNNDGGIPTSTYPNLHPYPTGKTTDFVTVIQPGRPAYNWQSNNFQRPAEEDLVVYELLVRDFVAAHDYQTLIDTLDYLDYLGVNAIELMPVNEFEGNESWGYNPSFHMALDKYYGTMEKFKEFIDACHSRGIAVILDVVYNHAFSQSPLCQLYWDAVNFRPAPDNPWLNPVEWHPFNVGYDFDHGAQPTKDWVKRVMKYWLEEFRVDGFRFDLSKGFTTQADSTTDVGAWGAYNANRIAIIKDYADYMWSVAPGTYPILEHFADNGEETELANYGLLFWGNLTHEYQEGAMGYSSNPEWIDYQRRGWSNPKLVGYMESHDEERLIFKNLQFGNSGTGYDIRDLSTALDRVELVSNFFYTLPGPKMLWQFGEYGYDISIDDPCRVCNKPILWNYFAQADRRRLYQVTRALIRLKQDYPVFRTTQYNYTLGSAVKKIWLDDANMNVVVHGNYNVVSMQTTADFHHTGWWYEYYTGDSLNVTNVNMNITLTPGEYRLYTDVRLPLPDLDGTITNAEEPVAPDFSRLLAWPNPASERISIRYELTKTGHTDIAVYDLMGREMQVLARGHQAKGEHTVFVDAASLAPGNYLVRLRGAAQTESTQIVIAR